ncbi:MAG: thymidylate synthase [Bacilli bacterium]|nr:thymidylate synthase [Bacilli bacterium]
MSKWDKEYIRLCKKILKDGVLVNNRTGTNSIKIPFYNLSFDLSKEFPVLTTKQLYFNKAITEILWIYQAASNDVRWLQERDNHIWDEWEIDEDGKWKANQMVFDNGKLVKKEVVRTFDKSFAHTIGTAYGYIVKRYNMMEKLIDKIKNNPSDRRMVMSLWQDEFLDTAVLPSCVWSSEWDVTDGRINCLVHQRSCDVPLGLPFNVTQYAVLVNLVAHVTGLEVGTLNWSIKDAHIYVNQVDGIKEQIRRFDQNGDLKAPKLWINPDVRDFFKIDNSKDLCDIKIIDYKHMGPIKFPISQ